MKNPLRSFLQRRTDEERVITSQDFWGAWARGDDNGPGGISTLAGVRVSRETALTISAVWRSVSLIADAISTMPAYAYVGDEVQKAPLQPQPRWLTIANSEQTFLECTHQQVVSLLLDGTAYIYTPRDNYGDVQETWLVDSRLVIPRREPNPRTGRLELCFYVYPQPVVGSYYAPNPPDNFRGAIRLDHTQMFHVRAFTLPGWLRGTPPLEMARNMLGGAIAGQEMGTRFYGQGMNAQGIIEVPEGITDQETKDLKEDFRNRNAGLRNMHMPPVLTGGATWKPISITPEQAQFLEARKFSVEEVARWFGVPPHLLSNMEKATSWGAGLQEQGIAFVRHTLLPWMERLEQAYSRYLYLLEPNVFVCFDPTNLLRGNAKEEAETQAVQVLSGLRNRDELRARDNLPPIPNGEGQAFLTPLNVQASGGENATALIKSVSAPQVAAPGNGNEPGKPPASEGEQ